MKRLIVLITAATMLFIAGCSTLGNGQIDVPNIDDTRTEAVVRLALRYAVVRTIDGHTDRAHGIATLAGELIAIASADETVPTDAIDIAISDRLNTLQPTERQLAIDLVAVTRSEIEYLLTQHALPNDRRVLIIRVLTWVRDAAQAVEATQAT